MSDESEEWRPMTGFPSYEVSDAGRVRVVERVRGGYYFHVMSQQWRAHREGSRKGSMTVALTDDLAGRRRTTVCVARKVLEAFRPTERMHERVAMYLDGDARDCRLSNLAWSEVGSNSRVDLLADLAAPTHHPLDLGERRCARCAKPFRTYGTSAFDTCAPCRDIAEAEAARLVHCDESGGVWSSNRRGGSSTTRRRIVLPDGW